MRRTFTKLPNRGGVGFTTSRASVTRARNLAKKRGNSFSAKRGYLVTVKPK